MVAGPSPAGHTTPIKALFLMAGPGQGWWPPSLGWAAPISRQRRTPIEGEKAKMARTDIDRLVQTVQSIVCLTLFVGGRTRRAPQTLSYLNNWRRCLFRRLCPGRKGQLLREPSKRFKSQLAPVKGKEWRQRLHYLTITRQTNDPQAKLLHQETKRLLEREATHKEQ